MALYRCCDLEARGHRIGCVGRERDTLRAQLAIATAALEKIKGKPGTGGAWQIADAALRAIKGEGGGKA